MLLDSSLLRSGSALRETLRSRRHEWPVIVLCAGADEAARQEARDLGARFLLNKPVDAKEWLGKPDGPKAKLDNEKPQGETIAYDDFVACGGEAKAKETGKLRVEGKEYIVADGDVMHFRFNV